MKAKAFFFHKPHSFYLKATVFLLLSDIVIQILIFHFIKEASLVSDASKKLLKTLTPLALFVASQCSVANAAGTIQIVGPEGKDQTVSSQVVTQSQPARATTTTATVIKERKTAPTKVYGPTREDETLWSIASRVNPSNTTSVQQTLLAIYRLNPQAFENNNIHGLEPNSRLRLPTLEQVRRENTDDAKQLLIAHKKKQAAQHASAQKTVRSTTTEKAPVSVKKEVAPTVNKVKPSAVEAKPTKDIIKVATPSASAVELKSELETTEQEFSALQENNHQLRVRLAEVQNEVDNLKNSLGDEDRIRSEVEKFINEQKQLAAAEKKAEPSAMDNLASSPGLIALLALIPGALIAGLIAFFLFRRKKEEDEESSESAATEQPSALIMPDDNFNMDDDIPEISLDDDDDLLGDLNDDEFLFGDDDSDSNDDLFAEFETEKSTSDNDDPFASLDDEDNDDLDSMLSGEELDLDLDLDGLDDDIDMSSSALTVDAEEKALGLEEMEKALNDFDSDLFSASDLEEEDDDFDLSLIDDSELSALDKSAPELDDNEDLEGGELDQSMLDDLFSSMDMEDDSEDSELDQGWDLDEKEETKLAPEPMSNSVEDELDFDTLLSGIEDTNKLDEEPNKGESIELDNDDIDAALFGEQNEDSVNLEPEEDATTLLDEVLEESDDEESIELDIEDDSTALLDELLDESDNEEDSIDLGIEDDSTALLDELLGDDEELSEDDNDIELDEDSTALLDELLADEDEEETIELGEDSTVLLDELLGDDVEEEETTSGKSGDDTEGVAVSETLSEDAPRDEDWLIEADEDEDDDIPLFESDTKQDGVSLELEEPLEQEVPSLEATEQVQESELVTETDDEFDGLFGETEELDVENDELLTEDDEALFELDELLEPEAELETEQDDVSLELEEPLEQEVPSLEATEQAQESELVTETDDEFDGLFGETEELDVENDELLTEDDEASFELDELLEPKAEQEESKTEALNIDRDEEKENDFSLDDFLENSAVDFSKENDDILPQSDDVENDDSSFEGLSIEDALASLEDDKDVENINSESVVSDEVVSDEPTSENEASDTEDKSAAFDFQSRVSDEEKEALTHLDSSGLDLDSMLDDGASDWSGFNLDNTSNTDSELEDEDWSEQPSVENDPHGADRFLSIEALIAESENGDKSEFEEEELNLDVGLDEFPDMLNNREAHDVDVNSDAQSKLDLAKAYIEMSDDKGALELLEEVLRCDDPGLKVEAEKLMKQID